MRRDIFQAIADPTRRAIITLIALQAMTGVDSYVPYAGKLIKDNLEVTLGKMKSTMCSCGVTTITDLKSKARITLVSSTSLIEGGAHDVILKEAKS